MKIFYIHTDDKAGKEVTDHMVAVMDWLCGRTDKNPYEDYVLRFEDGCVWAEKKAKE